MSEERTRCPPQYAECALETPTRDLSAQHEEDSAMKQACLVLFTAFLVFPSCSTDPNVKEFERAAAAVEQMVSPFNAPRISFYVVLPNGTPRQFVSWYFSSLGTADWAPTDEPGEFGSDELESMRNVGMALRPAGIRYTHTKPDTTYQKQMVLKWDDAEGTIILEGYLDPSQEPIFTKSFKLPRNVVPSEIARIAAQSNLEMGAQYQSF